MREVRPMPIYFYTTRCPYGCFSSFSRHGAHLEGASWPTSEHRFQARQFAGTPHHERVRRPPSPKLAAAIGRNGGLRLRPGLQQVQDDVVRRAVRRALKERAAPRHDLFAGGEQEIVDAAPRAHYWGCSAGGSARNMLGRIPMQVRAGLRARARAGHDAASHPDGSARRARGNGDIVRALALGSDTVRNDVSSISSALQAAARAQAIARAGWRPRVRAAKAARTGGEACSQPGTAQIVHGVRATVYICHGIGAAGPDRGRPRRTARHSMRILWTLIAAVIIAALAIFVVQNTGSQPMTFLGYRFTTSIGWVVGGGAILGFIFAFLLLAPGRLAAGWRGRTLARERARLEQELAAVRSERQRLEADHERLQSEHRQVVAERDRLQTRPMTPAAPPASTAAAPATSASTTAPGERSQQTLGDRMRGMFQRPEQASGSEEGDQIPQGPAAPTA
jgi:N-glycosidase YbiA